MKKALISLLFFGLLLVFSCGGRQIKFNKKKWLEIDDGFYSSREKMIQDILENHLKPGMTYYEIVQLLGPQENLHLQEKNTMGYTEMVDYGWDIDPVETKTLYIELDEDSTLKYARIDHWESGQ